MTLVPDEKLAELKPPRPAHAELGDFLDQHLHVRRREGWRFHGGAESGLARAGVVMGSAPRFTCFSLRARRRNFFFFFIFFTVLTEAAVPALR